MNGFLFAIVHIQGKGTQNGMFWLISNFSSIGLELQDAVVGNEIGVSIKSGKRNFFCQSNLALCSHHPLLEASVRTVRLVLYQFLSCSGLNANVVLETTQNLCVLELPLERHPVHYFILPSSRLCATTDCRTPSFPIACCLF